MEGSRSANLSEAVALVELAEQRGLSARILGGIAIALHCPSSGSEGLRRPYRDLDLVMDRRAGAKHADGVLASFGYEPDMPFNALNARDGRRRYQSPAGRAVDVFLGKFRMCHDITLEERMSCDAPTLPVADLLLTKAQIVEITPRDLVDLTCLLLDHPIGTDDAEAINSDRIAVTTGADWGLWRTVLVSLERVRSNLAELAIRSEERATVAGRIDELTRVLNTSPKTRLWKMRARVGERKRWYNLPEEPE